MAEAKHTPGPWELRRTEFGLSSLVYPVGQEFPVASTTGYYSRAGQSLANARLVAAAPDLLEACEAVMRDFERFTQNHKTAGEAACIGTVRAAITKATS